MLASRLRSVRAVFAFLGFVCLPACGTNLATGAPGEQASLLAAPLAAHDALPPEKMVAHFIDVDQGNAALLEFSCGAILIDVGGQGDDSTTKLVDYLTTFFGRRTDLHETLDAVFVTHPHIDHNRAMKAVMGKFKVKHYVDDGKTIGSGRFAAQWVRDASKANERKNEPTVTAIPNTLVTAVTSKAGFTSPEVDPLDCSGTDPKLHVLSGGRDDNPGWPDSAFDNLNNHSLVIRVDFGPTSLLFTGDLEEEAIETLLDFYHGTSTLDVDLYHVGHHGSANGTTEALLDALTPDYAIISMGRWNDKSSAFCANAFGHPRKTIVDMLDDHVATLRTPVVRRAATAVHRFRNVTVSKAIYATGWDGNIRMTVDLNGAVTFATDH